MSGPAAWETLHARSWENLEESEEGVLRELGNANTDVARASTQTIDRPVRRGVVRALVLALDCSRASSDSSEFRPNYISVMMTIAKEFAKLFFEENPLSYLALVCSRDGIALRLCGLSSNCTNILPMLDVDVEDSELTPSGDYSNQNTLELCRSVFQTCEKYATKEVLIMSASLTSVDPGDVFETIAALKKERASVSAISFAAPTFVLKRASTETHGTYSVCLNVKHARELLLAHLQPRPIDPRDKAAANFCSQIETGFPCSSHASSRKAFELSHIQRFSKPGIAADTLRAVPETFACPRCATIHEHLPVTCRVCQLRLLAAPLLARSYHHLFPIPIFVRDTAPDKSKCDGCEAVRKNTEEIYYACPKCGCAYCPRCDEFIRRTMHNCVGCGA